MRIKHIGVVLAAMALSATPLLASAVQADAATAPGTPGSPRWVATAITPNGAYVKSYTIGAGQTVKVASANPNAVLQDVKITGNSVAVQVGGTGVSKDVPVASLPKVTNAVRLDVARAVADPGTSEADVAHMVGVENPNPADAQPMGGHSGGTNVISSLGGPVCYGYNLGYSAGNACTDPRLTTDDGRGNWKVLEVIYGSGWSNGVTMLGPRTMKSIQSWATHPVYNTIVDYSPAGSRPDSGAGCRTDTLTLYYAPWIGVSRANTTCNGHISPILPYKGVDGRVHGGVRWDGNRWVTANGYVYHTTGEFGISSPSNAHYYGTVVSGYFEWYG